MAVYDLEEQEQLDELKTWWKQYGNLVTALVAALALAAAGWQGWNWWQRKQSAEASALYAGTQLALQQRDARRARQLAGELIDKYGSTTYAGMAALLSGKAQAESGDLKSARVHLQWAAENAGDPALRDLARLRLAATLLDEKSYDEAAKQLAAEPATPAFAPRYGELRGDLLAAQGKAAEAAAAYQAALDKLSARVGAGDTANGGYKAVLQVKLESLGGVAK